MAPNCERWLWIELIGFDNRDPGASVRAFLDNCGFAPDGISLLIATPDFVHTHAGMEREVVFPPDYCSYGGKPHNSERQRQEWTNWQLLALVEALRIRGIRVCFANLNIFASRIDGISYRSPWCDSHPELLEFTRDGVAASCINPLKRLADGRWYEDVFVERLAAAVRDYGFDGYQVADGYSSPRQPIWLADYSDDMVAQFREATGLDLPAHAADAGATRARADRIWQCHRRAWCEFYACRFERFLGKICHAMHGLGREVCCNNAWARDPFEAYYRYGVDYRRLARAGVDRFLLETVGAGVSIGAESGFRADLRFELNFMLAEMKACLPGTPMLCLNGTGDTTESWDLLNHAPAVSEREIYTLGHLFVQEPGGLRRASAGPFVCLADGISATQWSWLRRNWEVAYGSAPKRTLGAAVLWSAAALDREFDEYLADRLLSRQRLAAELQARGAPLQVVAPSASLAAVRGCLLVPRPELLPTEELAAVLAYRHGPLVLIGRRELDLPPPDLEFAEGAGARQLVCRIYHAGLPLAVPPFPPMAPAEPPPAPPDPPDYLHGMFYRETNPAFLQACADLLVELTPTPRVEDPASALRVLATEEEDGTIRVLVGNEDHIYAIGRLDLRRNVRDVRIASHYPGRPLLPDGRFLRVQVPPRGMIVLDVVPA